MDEIVQFDFPTDSPKIIKVIGVGGGGGNAKVGRRSMSEEINSYYFIWVIRHVKFQISNHILHAKQHRIFVIFKALKTSILWEI